MQGTPPEKLRNGGGMSYGSVLVRWGAFSEAAPVEGRPRYARITHEKGFPGRRP